MAVPIRECRAIQLNGAQVSDIVTFVKSRISAADIRSANRTPGGSADKLLTGNAQPVKHSSILPDVPPAIITGDIPGISRKYSAAALQARFLYPQQKRTAATVTDSRGNRYAGDLLSLTNYDVAIQDAGGWYPLAG